MIKIKLSFFKKFIFEFLSIFFAVVFAFMLNSWNEERKDRVVENKILLEIYNGLERDSLDLASDEKLFSLNINAKNYFTRIINNIEVKIDSLPLYYHFLTRDIVIIQNKSGYQTLKSKGLEIIINDSLRKSIIDLYEVTYELQRKFSEEYDENKYMRNYFENINDIIAPNLIFNDKGKITGIRQPINLNEKEKSMINSYFWKLAINRNDRLGAIKGTQRTIGKLRALIKQNLE